MAKKVDLEPIAQEVIDEARMVLPGIQALFGFQLIAVFSPGFAQKLTLAEQRLHLVAIALLAIAVALIMAPAAYHRQRGPQEVTSTFIHLATRLLLWSMVPLALSICIEFYLVGRVIEDGAIVPLGAAFLFAVFVGLWFVLPHVRSSKWTGSKRERTS